MSRESIACALLGIGALEPGGFAPCPGREKHTRRDGVRDFRVLLSPVPTGFCFHGSCSEEVDAFNLQLRRRIWHEENGSKRLPPTSIWRSGSKEPQAPRPPSRPPFRIEALREAVRDVKEMITPEWFIERSPMPLRRGLKDVAVDFLEALYEPGEKVLVFTEFRSQGQYGYHVGHGGWRLGRTRDVRAVPSELPDGAKDGVWFLCNPVCGEWRINNAAMCAGGDPKWGRRHGECITSWRYMVLENDEAPQELWLKFLAKIPLPLAAIYTSGGRSVHALVRLDAASKQHWDGFRNGMLPLLSPAGADPAAMTGVRLTRLPGCMRGDRLQELWYVNPKPKQETSMLRG